MSGIVATAHPHVVPGFFTGSHMLWIGVLIGMAVALIIARTLITVLLAVFALVELGAFHLISHHVAGHHPNVRLTGIGPWLLVAGVAVVVGLLLGRKRTLGHLGIADFRTRLAAVSKVSKW